MCVWLQLQRLFAALQESEQRFVETRAFCESYRELDGSPVNPNIQVMCRVCGRVVTVVGGKMDVDEFCRLLFDRVEQRLKGSASARVIDDIFALTQLTQVACDVGIGVVTGAVAGDIARVHARVVAARARLRAQPRGAQSPLARRVVGEIRRGRSIGRRQQVRLLLVLLLCMM